MQTKIEAQSEMPATPVPIVSKLAVAPASDAVKQEADARIQELAYKLYEERGRVDGSDLQDWFEAESILHEHGKLAA